MYNKTIIHNKYLVRLCYLFMDSSNMDSTSMVKIQMFVKVFLFTACDIYRGGLHALDLLLPYIILQ